MTTEERLENLERELAGTKRINRWLLAAVGLALGVWTLAVALGPSPAGAQGGGAALKEVRANRFVVEDEKGAVRAVLEAKDREDWAKERAVKGMDIPSLEKAAPALHLYDDKGTVRASLRLSKTGPQLCLNDKGGEEHVRVFDSSLVGPILGLYHGNRRSIALLTADAEGPALRLSAAGKVRAVLSVADEKPALCLFDGAGNPRASLMEFQDNPILSLNGEAGKVGAWIRVTADGGGLALTDATGKTRASLGLGKDGPGLELYDAAGKTGAELAMSAKGPILGLFDAAGNQRAGLGVPAHGPMLVLYDAAGIQRAGLGVPAHGPMLELYDAAGKPRAVLGKGQATTPDGKMMTYPESSLRLSGPDGNIRWQTP